MSVKTTIKKLLNGLSTGQKILCAVAACASLKFFPFNTESSEQGSDQIPDTSYAHPYIDSIYVLQYIYPTARIPNDNPELNHEKIVAPNEQSDSTGSIQAKESEVLDNLDTARVAGELPDATNVPLQAKSELRRLMNSLPPEDWIPHPDWNQDLTNKYIRINYLKHRIEDAARAKRRLQGLGATVEDYLMDAESASGNSRSIYYMYAGGGLLTAQIVAAVVNDIESLDLREFTHIKGTTIWLK